MAYEIEYKEGVYAVVRVRDHFIIDSSEKYAEMLALKRDICRRMRKSGKK